MSSNAYSASLTPDPWLRIAVLTSGRLLVAAGLVMILISNASVTARSAGGLAWLGLGYFEIRRILQGFGHLIALRIRPGGRVEVQNGDREWVSGELQSGSIVLGQFAWLRVKTDSGLQCAEFICGDGRSSANWRRLRVIWRHIGG